MKYIFVLCFFIAGSTFGQDCNCAGQFMFVKKYYEENNPAFQEIKSNKKLLKAYNDSVQQIFQMVSKEVNNDLCNIYFIRYVKLLKDHHSGIELNLARRVSFSSQAVMDSFKSTVDYRAFKIKAIDTAQILERLKNSNGEGPEGIYALGNDIRIALLKNGKDHYEGIVMRKTSLLEVGHVLLTLDKQPDNTYSCLYNMGLLGLNFNTSYSDNIRLIAGNLPRLGLYRVGNRPLAKQWDFKVLDSNTCYLAIRSFEDDLDSLYHAVIPEIKKRKLLILDVRDNIGGAEKNYFDLLPLFYTKPFELDQMAVWVSPDNIASYEGSQDDLVAKMKAAPLYSYLYLNRGDSSERWRMEGTEFPKKIAVLYNRGSASAAEGLVTYAMQSSKVITMGEHSGGYVGYGDIRDVTIPCGKFILRTTRTKWKNKSKYEYSGIPPMVSLHKESDWVKAAVRYLGN